MYDLHFPDGTTSRFREVETGAMTYIDGTPVYNTCLARSIAYAQAMATMERPPNDDEIAYWVRGLGCKGYQLDVVQKRDTIARHLGLGVRLRVMHAVARPGDATMHVRHAFDIPEDDGVVDRDAVIMHKRMGRDVGHFVAMVPIEDPRGPGSPPSELNECVNPMYGFMNSNTLVMDPRHYMPWTDFVKRFKEYCNQNGLVATMGKRQEDTYLQCLQKFGCTRTDKRETRLYPQNSTCPQFDKKVLVWLVGADVPENCAITNGDVCQDGAA
jgi:hypothetical protein